MGHIKGCSKDVNRVWMNSKELYNSSYVTNKRFWLPYWMWCEGTIFNGELINFHRLYIAKVLNKEHVNKMIKLLT